MHHNAVSMLVITMLYLMSLTILSSEKTSCAERSCIGKLGKEFRKALVIPDHTALTSQRVMLEEAELKGNKLLWLPAYLVYRCLPFRSVLQAAASVCRRALDRGSMDAWLYQTFLVWLVDVVLAKWPG